MNIFERAGYWGECVGAKLTGKPTPLKEDYVRMPGIVRNYVLTIAGMFALILFLHFKHRWF